MSAPSKSFKLWTQVPILRLLLPYIAGVLLYDKLPVLFGNDIFIGIALFTVFTLNSIVFLFSIRKKNLPLVSIITTSLLLCTIAYSISYIQDERNSKYWFGNFQNVTKATTAIVLTEPQEKNKTTKYEIRLCTTLTEKAVLPCVGKAYLYVYKKENAIKCHKGDTLLLPGDWAKINNSGNPFEVDYQKNCARKNFHFQQFVSPEQVAIYAQQNTQSISLWDNVHHYCISSINQYIMDSTTNALLKAMLIGDEKDIDPNTREAYADTGIIHIVSISGAHVAILFAAMGYLLSFIKNKKYQWLKLLLSLMLIWFYVILAGSSTPALRAALMFTILVIGNVTNQRNNPLNQLFSTAFILLLFQPMWLFTIGFQLSFTAVFSLIVFYPTLSTILKPKNKIGLFFNNAIAASIAAEILVAPLVAYYFHSFPVMFILANIWASLAMGTILVLGMLLVLLAKIGSVAAILSTIIVFISTLFHKGIYLLQQINISSFKTIFIPITTLIIGYFFIAQMTVALSQKRKKSFWAALACLLILSLQHLQRSVAISQQEKLIVFNQSKEAHCEIYRGNTYCIANGTKTESHSTHKAHIGFATLQKSIDNKNQLFIIKGKKVLLLDSLTNTTKPFPIDVLVITSASKRIDVAGLKKKLQPQKIVLANNLKNYQINEWINACKEENLALHYTKKDGAFILE